MVQSVSCLADHSSQRFSGSRDGSFAPVFPRGSERFSPLCPAVRTSPIRDATIRAAARRDTQLLDQFFVWPRSHSTWKPAPTLSGRRPLGQLFWDHHPESRKGPCCHSRGAGSQYLLPHALPLSVKLVHRYFQ